jgi:NAD(P)H-hydrate repair Nnr-like enzyme with NAD(P)H-hydrate dehydratase domain
MARPIAVDHTFLHRWVRAPKPEDHKYSRGVLALVTGSLAYPGAALIGVEAAVRTGVGMVRYSGPGTADALVVGSGMVSPIDDDTRARVTAAIAQGIPSVVDAGALELVENFGPLTVLTPHHGELEALLERLGIPAGATDRESAQKLAQKLSMTVLVKGANGAVVDGSGGVWELPKATPWLATAGTGDALAGILGALLAAWHERLHESPELLGEAVAAGALIHQIAAARASARAVGDADSPTGGPFSVMDVCREIPAVIGDAITSWA